MIITLTGENSYALKSELKTLVNDFVAKHGDMGLERIDGQEADPQRITEAIQNLPFLSSKKLIILRSPGANKTFAEAFSDLVETVPDSIDVIIVEPRLDKRGKYYKTLKKVTDFREFNELDENGLIGWLTEVVKKQGGDISRNDASFLVRRIGVNQQMLHSEITKLLQYDPKVNKETIELLTEPTPQSSTFDLLDAALAGKTIQALEIYDDQRKQKVEPLAIMGLLGWQLHVLALIKTAGKKDPGEIAHEAKLNPYVVRKSMGLARAFTLDSLKDLVAETKRLDVRMKSENIDADEAMKHLIIRLGNRLN